MSEPVVSEAVHEERIEPHPDHTKWKCHRETPTGLKCPAVMPMEVPECSKCNKQRGEGCVALNDSEDVLGKCLGLDEVEGKEKWFYYCFAQLDSINDPKYVDRWAVEIDTDR